ncbi:hypothetical protein MMC19_006076 [Ptychographa xylographoides]|nr:hypothetical protein [Ptychographa xylographoides]
MEAISTNKVALRSSEHAHIPRCKSPSPPSLPPKPLKRQRKTLESESQPKRARRNRNKAPKLVEDEDIDFEHGINNALGELTKHLLADYLALKTKQFTSDLSLVELEERQISACAIQDSSSWHKRRLLQNLPDFLTTYSTRAGTARDLSNAPQKNGTPHSIVIAAAGLRAADLTRSLRVFETKDSAVTKLFAKHIKLKDAVGYVGKTRMGIGVGTPARLIALLDSGQSQADYPQKATLLDGAYYSFSLGALTSESLERIIVDFSYVDQKKRGILDMKESQEPLMQLLTRKEFTDRYERADGGIDLLFF